MFWVVFGGLFAWAGARHAIGWRKALLIPMFIFSSIAALSVMKTLWGTCIPNYLEFRSGKTSLVSRDWVEGKNIWLWIKWPDNPNPVCYMFPWSEEMARELEAAEQAQNGPEDGVEGDIIVEFGEGEDEGAGEEPPENLAQRLPFSWKMTETEIPNVYLAPQAAEEPKEDQRRLSNESIGGYSF
jgi:hypothetical protein